MNGDDVPFTEDIADSPVKLVDQSQSKIVGQNAEETYKTGVILSKEWQA